MSLLDLLVILAFFAVLLLAKIPLSTFALAVVVGTLILVRVLRGERL